MTSIPIDTLVMRLREDARSYAQATQMVSDAKSSRNQAAEGGEWPGYAGLKPEETNAWKAADEIERLRKVVSHQYDALLECAAHVPNFADDKDFARRVDIARAEIACEPLADRASSPPSVVEVAAIIAAHVDEVEGLNCDEAARAIVARCSPENIPVSPGVSMTVKCCTCPATTTITAANSEKYSIRVAGEQVGWGYRWMSNEFDCPICKNKPRSSGQCMDREKM